MKPLGLLDMARVPAFLDRAEFVEQQIEVTFQVKMEFDRRTYAMIEILVLKIIHLEKHLDVDNSLQLIFQLNVDNYLNKIKIIIK